MCSVHDLPRLVKKARWFSRRPNLLGALQQPYCWCVAQQQWLACSTVWKFARRTREYRGAYKVGAAQTATHQLTEKLRRAFKCHRSAFDFDFRFIRDS